jgi:hypothetical protein
MPLKPSEYRLPTLVSYAFLREFKRERVGSILKYPRYDLLLDSGAFTAMNAGKEIPLGEYMEFLGEWGSHLFGYMALDKLQDPVQTDKNLQVMLGAGLRPIPIHVFGDGADRMEELFTYSDWVALGGLRRPHRGSAPRSYVRQKMLWAKGRKVHWLGYTDQSMILRYRPYSVDCSSFSAGVQYGLFRMYFGRGRWRDLGQYDEFMAKRRWLEKDVARALDYYEIPVDEITDPRHWKRGERRHEVPTRTNALNLVNSRSWVRYAFEMLGYFGVRVFLAAVPARICSVTDAIEFFDKRGEV